METQRVKKIKVNLDAKELVEDSSQIDDYADVSDLQRGGAEIDCLFPMEFGGFLVCESEQIHYYRKTLKNGGKVATEQLRSPQKITSICCIDKSVVQGYSANNS